MSFSEILCILIVILIFILISVWGLIFLFIIRNKIRARKKIIFEKNFLQEIIAIHSNIKKQETSIRLRKLKKHLKKDSEYLWEFSSVFVKFNRVIKFSKKQEFKAIFNFLKVGEILKEKINNENWYVKARAICLSYEFELEDNIKIINKYRDDENTLVRREAQIALVSFLGWRSLVFFPYITRYISLWQQIRIIEKLKESTNELDFRYLEKALLSKNKTVIELLIRIIKNFKLEDYKYYVIQQLFSEDNKLINAATEALKYFTITRKEIKEVGSRFSEKPKENQYVVIFEGLE